MAINDEPALMSIPLKAYSAALGFKFPRLIGVGNAVHDSVEVTRQTTNGGLVADIRLTQAARSHAANVVPKLC